MAFTEEIRTLDATRMSVAADGLTEANHSVRSDDPLVRMFAVLDRRVGKRTLLNMKEELDSQPEWLQQVYALRFRAESV